MLMERNVPEHAQGERKAQEEHEPTRTTWPTLYEGVRDHHREGEEGEGNHDKNNRQPHWCEWEVVGAICGNSSDQ